METMIDRAQKSDCAALLRTFVLFSVGCDGKMVMKLNENDSRLKVSSHIHFFLSYI